MDEKYRLTIDEGTKDAFVKEYTREELESKKNYIRDTYAGRYKIDRVGDADLDNIDDTGNYTLHIGDFSKSYTGSELKSKMDYINQTYGGQYTVESSYGSYNDMDSLFNDLPSARERLEAFNVEHGAFMNDFEARDTAETKMARAGMSSGLYIPSENAVTGEERQKYLDLYKQEEALKKAYYTSDEYLAQKEADSLYLSQMRDSIQKQRAEYSAANPTQEIAGAEFVPAGAAVRRTRGEADREMQMFNTASRIMDDTIKLHNAPSKYDGQNVFRKFFKGSGETLTDMDFWTAGLAEIADNFGVRDVLKSVQDKLENLNDLSEEAIEGILSPAEKAVLQAWAMNAQEQVNRKDDLSRAYQGGQGAVESLGFMAEFALTGGVNKAVTEGVEAMTRWLGKKVLNSMDDATARAVKAFGEKAVKSAVGKYGIGLAESLAGAAGRTMVMPSTYRNIAEKATEIKEDGEGNRSLVRINDAFAEGYVDSFIENLSEGGRVNALGELVGDVAGKIPAFRKIVDTFSKSEIADLYRALSSSGIMNTLRAGGWHGFGEEYLEEWYGNALRALTIDKDALKDFATVDNQLITVTSFLPMTIFGGSISTAQVLFAKRGLDKKAEALKSALLARGYDESQVNNMIDMMRGSNPSQVSQTLTPIVNAVARRDDYDAAALMKPVGEFAEAVRKWQSFDTKYQYQEQEQRDNLRTEMESALGKFWQEDEEGRQTVQRAANENGDVVYLLDKPSAQDLVPGEITPEEAVPAVTADGRKVFVQLSDYQLEDELEMNVFLGNEIMAEKGNQEQVRMLQEKEQRLEEIKQLCQPGTTVNLGTTEAPNMGEITQTTPDGVVVVTSDGAARQVSYSEMGNYVGVNATPLTDAQMNERDADALSADRAQREAELDMEYENLAESETELVEAESEVEQAVEAAIPLPTKEDGSVDQTALWNSDPARWAQWNDSQRNDGGVNSLGYINAAITREESKINKLIKAYNAEPDFDVRASMEQQIAGAQTRLDQLVSLQQQYAPQQAVVENIVDNSAVAVEESTTAPAAEPKPRERSTESVISDLLSKGLSEEEVNENIQANVSDAQKKLAAHAKKAPKMGTDADAYISKKQKHAQKMQELQQELDFWTATQQALTGLNEQNKQIPEAPEVVSIEKDPEPQNAVEFAARELGLREGGIKLQRKSFAQHTGYGNEEMKKFFGLFKSKQDGGMTLEEAGERLMELDREDNTGFFDQNDPNAGLEAILDALSANKTIGELRSYTARQRQEEAQREADAAYSAMMAEYETTFGETMEESAHYDEVMRSEIFINGLSENEQKELNNIIFAEEILQNGTEGYQTEASGVYGSETGSNATNVEPGTEGVYIGSNGILQETQSDNSGRDAESQGSQRRSEGEGSEQDALPSVSSGESATAVESSLDEDMPDFLGMSDEDVIRRATDLVSLEAEQARRRDEKLEALDSEYQDRLSEIDKRLAEASEVDRPAIVAERAALIQEYLDRISSEDKATVLTPFNYADTMRSKGCTEKAIGEVEEQLARPHIIVGGFISRGNIFVMSDVVDINDARRSYIHERQHISTQKNPSLINRVINAVSGRRELQMVVQWLAGTDNYSAYPNVILADEIISFAMERAYSSEDFVSSLKYSGVENPNLLTVLTEIYDEQRNDNSLSQARRRRGLYPHESNNAKRNRRQNDGNSSAGSDKVGEQGLRPAETGREGTGLLGNRQQQGTVLFRATNGSLVGMHNISEEKLRKVFKLGGFANPSSAVIDIDRQLHEGYGEISLIMPSSLVDAETGRNAGTFTADAWTPTYPPISRKVDDRGWEIIKDRIRAAIGEESELYSDIVHGVDNYLDDNHSSKMEFVFLKEKGIEPEIAYKGADGFVGMRNLEAILGVQGLRDGVESYERYKNASPMAKRSFNMWLDAAGNKQSHRELKEQLKKEPKLADVLKLNEDVSFADFDSFTYDIFRKEQDAGKIDTYDTMRAAARYVDANNLRGEFEAWLESLMEQAGAKEVFFAGYTRSGDRIYKDNTLENVSRHMRLQGRTNAYGDHGLSATMSDLLQRLTSLSQIRKNKGRLQNEATYNKEYDALKDRLWSIISQLADMQEISSNQFMNVDYAESRLQEAITKRNPIAHLNKEYGYDIDPAGEYADEIKSFIKDVQQMSAKYFETKFERPVYLNEFAAAVMPTTTSEDIKQAVSEAGLPIFEYDSAVKGSRREATLKATEGEGIRFRSTPSDRVLSLFNQARAGKLSGKPITIGSLTKEGKEYLEKISGIKLKENVSFVLNPSDLNHIYNDHYGENEKDTGNNIPLNDYDIRRLVDVIAFPTNVVYGNDKQGRKVFYFLSDTPSGAYNLMEVYADRHGNLTAKTYYKTKKGASQRVMELESLLSTSETYSGATLSDAKIPILFDIANQEEDNVRFRTSNDNQAIFVSNAAKAVEGIKQEKATPEQWLKMIEKNGGLKAGEDKWMGLSDWLKASDKKTLTKQEVLDFINDNMIVIEEQHYSEDENALDGKRQEIQEALQGIFDEYVAESEDMNDDMFMKTHYDYAIQKLADELGYTAFNAPFINNNAIVELDFYEDDLDTLHELSNRLGLEKYDGTRDINDTRLSYTTEGLTDRHEIALTVPTIEPWNERDDIHFDDAGDGRAIAWIRFGETWEQRPSPQISRKVLVIDEIQSKRHQEGRDRGYSMSREEYQKRLDALETEGGERLRRRTELLRTLKEKYGDDFRYYLKPSFNGDILANMPYVPNELVMSPEEVEEWNATSQEEINDAIDDLKKQKRAGVPDAPFDKNWHELAMKRMLRYAAENGYDVVAWTTGDQQAERYNIGTKINHIHVVPSEVERYVSISPIGGRIIETPTKPDSNIIVSGEYKGKSLSDVYGKTLADRIMSIEIGSDERIAGDGLRIGGEGMKGFYDKMLPAFMNKYGKKWGVKVEDIDLPNLGKFGYTMHSVPVTEEMKASVMEGQVMFRTTEITPEVRDEMDVISATALINGTYMQAPNGKPTNLTAEQWAMVRTKNFLRWFGDWINDPENASKVVDENGEPKVVYHGSDWNPTDEEPGNAVFMRDRRGIWFTGDAKRAQRFADSRMVDGRGVVTAAFLNIRKPSDREYPLASQDDWRYYYELGYDGWMSWDGNKLFTVVVQSPSQIKSATDNTGGFSEEEGDIRFRVADSESKREIINNTEPVDVTKGMIVATDGESVSKAALRWFEENVGKELTYNTEVGTVAINRRSVKNSLAHGYSQTKLDAITSLPEGFGRAVYLASEDDYDGKPEVNHYFVYPINYDGSIHYVLCRVKSDVNRSSLYIHEVFPIDAIKGHTLQTAADQSQPHRGISLYLDLLKEVLDSKDTDNLETTNDSEGNISLRVNENPTEAQKEAGNYKMGHLNLDGYRITIENPKGSVRRGTDSKGNAWENTLNNDYGYIRGTEGVDGDHIDVYLSDNPSEGNVFVIDQVNPQTREFDEHKVMYGFNSAEEAREAYLANFSEGWDGLGTITEVTKDEFKKWIKSSHRKTKPFIEYKSVKVIGAQSEGKEIEDYLLPSPGTPTDEVVANGLDLTPAQTAELAGNIFAALPEESRKKITEGLSNVFDLKDAILQIPTSLAMKEKWSDEDRQMADIVAEQLTKMAGDMTRPFSASEGLWVLYNSLNPTSEYDILSQASRAIVQRNLGFDAETLRTEEAAEEGVRFRTVGDASANASAALYNKGAVNVWTRLKESFVDMDASVEALVKAIEKKSGKAAQGFENILLALNQQSSKGLAANERYERKFLKPMLDEVKSIIKKTKKSYEDIVRYVILKHGLERNDIMAKRDARNFYKGMFDKVASRMKTQSHAQRVVALSDAKKALDEIEAKIALARGAKLERLKEEREAAVLEVSIAELVLRGNEQENETDLKARMDAIDAGTDTKYLELRERDYSGITSMFYDQLGVDRNNYQTEEEYQAAVMEAKQDKFKTLAEVEDAARAEVESFEREVDTAKLWKKINSATKETLRQQYEANMISKDQYETLRDMYQFYVPLRGFADNTAEDMYTYYRKPNTTGYTKPILGAEGRKTEAESPFGWIASMAGSAIASNVKNEAKLALYYFVANRPDNGIATITKTWFEFSHTDTSTGKKVYKPAYPPFTENLSSDAAKAAYEQWQKDMEQKRAAGQAYESGQRLDLGNSVVNISDKNKPEHIVNVKIGGKDYSIIINGNPRAAQAINGDLNIEATAGDYAKVFGPVLRWMSSVNTSYNPEFWITNMMRDMAFTWMNVNIQQDPAYRKRFAENYGNAFKIIRMNARNENGKIGDLYIENMYKDFVEYGGVTGYTQIKDSESWEEEIEKYMKSANVEDRKMAKVMDGTKTALHAMHRFGESLEQVSRFAAFMTSREMGKSMSEAISDAKEITVNFNRKGSGKMISWDETKSLTGRNGRPLNDVQRMLVWGVSSMAPLGRRMIMFFNASIQGLNATYKLAKANPKRFAGWMLGYTMLGVMNAVIHGMLDDDDNYLDIPQYERRTSLMLGGGGVYFKWALPQEARAFYALGDLAVETIMGRNPQGLLDEGSVLGQALSIVGDMAPINATEGWKALLPSVAVPFVELLTNEDYKGDAIYNDQKWLSKSERRNTAKWSSAYQGTGQMYIGISKLFNNMTGGDKYDAGFINIQPEKMQHLVQSAFGGTIRTLDKFVNMTVALIDPDEEWIAKQTPFLNRFLTINDERFRNVHVNTVYDYYMGEAEHALTLQKKYTKDRDSEALRELQRSDEYRWAQIYNKYKKPIKQLQEKIKVADGTAERKELMQQQDELKRRMIKEISELP